MEIEKGFNPRSILYISAIKRMVMGRGSSTSEVALAGDLGGRLDIKIREDYKGAITCIGGSASRAVRS